MAYPPPNEDDVRELLLYGERADDQDTFTLDEFRTLLTVGLVVSLASGWLAQRAAARKVLDYAAQHHLRGSAAVVSDELLNELRLAAVPPNKETDE